LFTDVNDKSKVETQENQVLNILLPLVLCSFKELYHKRWLWLNPGSQEAGFEHP